MTKEELIKEVNNCTVELRKLFEEVKDTSKSFNAEDVEKRQNEIENRKAKFEKELAELNRPAETGIDAKTEWRTIATAMEKRSSVTVNGTGAVLTVKELVKAITDNTDILNFARYFYGANSQTVIPVWASHVSAGFIAEGAGTAAQDKNLTTSTLIPKTAMASLPVSQMTLDMSAVNLEGELPEIFAEGFSRLMAEGMMTGDGTTNVMQGIFTDSNTIKVSKSISIENLAAFALDVRSKKFVKPVIVMSPTVYNQFLTDTTNTETVKIYKEDLIRNKSIEGVEVILTPYAPTSYVSTSTVAVGGDLSNYAIGVAGELKIKAKETASSDVTTFDAYSYFNGKPINSADFYSYVVA